MMRAADPGRGAVRVLRATGLATVALGLAAAAHLTGGGSLPGLAPAVGLFGLAAASSAVLTAQRIRPVAVLAWLGLAQLGLHWAFGALTQASGTTSTVGHHATSADLLVASRTVTAEHDHGTTMLVAHVLATLFTAAAVARGEDLLWTIWGLLAPRLPAQPVPGPRPVGPGVSSWSPGPASREPAGHPDVRGPPAALVSN